MKQLPMLTLGVVIGLILFLAERHLTKRAAYRRLARLNTGH